MVHNEISELCYNSTQKSVLIITIIANKSKEESLTCSNHSSLVRDHVVTSHHALLLLLLHMCVGACGS